MGKTQSDAVVTKNIIDSIHTCLLERWLLLN